MNSDMMSASRSFQHLIRSTRSSRNTGGPLFSASLSCYNTNNRRQFSAAFAYKMPETLKSAEVNSQTDPSVAKQYDSSTPKEQQIKDLFNMIDGKKIGMLNTYRNGVGKFCPSPHHPSTCRIIHANNATQAPLAAPWP